MRISDWSSDVCSSDLFGQEARLLLDTAVLQEARDDEAVLDRDDRRQSSVRRGDLHKRERIGDIVGPCPAHPLRRGHAHQAKARQFVKQLQRIATGRLISCRIGTNALLREGANHITNGRLGLSKEHKPTSLISNVQNIDTYRIYLYLGDER